MAFKSNNNDNFIYFKKLYYILISPPSFTLLTDERVIHSV